MNAIVPHSPITQLEDQITELAAHISAATWRLLTLIREYDLRSGWNCGGTKSCAHWLNWKCGIALGAAHHVVHWADGGETALETLVLLCCQHHRLVHEGGYAVSLTLEGEKRFRRPDGTPIAPGPDTRFRGNVFSLWAAHRRDRLAIGPGTLPSNWRGERMDVGMAVDSLLAREKSVSERPRTET